MQSTARSACFRTFLACTVATLLVTTAANAQTSPPIARNSFGSVGLIDTPSARMAPDGELSADAFFTKNTQRYNLGFQALPWLELGFRYSGLQHFDPLYPVYYDRSFALKARLWNETDFFPAVAVGVNDVIGTGAYGGEYLVASKQFGSVDATAGIGWGRQGSTAQFRNPLTLISSSFNNRPGQFGISTDPGAANFSALFHGRNVGLFGGLAWATPVDGLTLMAEYSSDAYTLEQTRGNFSPRTQVNGGASYQLTDSIALSASYFYGRSVAASISVQLDPVHDNYPQRIGPPLPEPRIRTTEEQQASLDALLTSHSVAGLVHADQRVRAFSANAQLADRLWQTPNLTDVTLHGHVILLTLAKGDPAAACRSVARVAGQYSTGIIAVRVSRGHDSQQCPVVAAPALMLASTSLDRDMGAVSLAAMDMAPHLIDAATRSAAGDKAAIAKIRADAAVQQIAISTVSLGRSEAIIYYANGHYSSEIVAIDRLTRLLMADAPAEIEKFRIISVVNGQPTREFDVLRAPAERTYSQSNSLSFADNVTIGPAPMRNPVLATAAEKTYPQLSYYIFPQFRQQLFDPQNPFGVQFLGALQSSLAILPGLSINGQAEFNLFDTFTTNRPASSDLPHVRTDFLQYFTKGKNGIAYLDAEYELRLAPDVFAAVRGGYIESMFAGIGGEVLWRPEGQRWALGLDAYDVQQRNFDRLLGLQNYRAFVGHVTLYYSSPWYDLDFAVHAGQYLAKDRGVTFEVTRRFETGVEIGAFFTTTNVSAQQFGEGSFDKGIIIRIPLDWVAPIQTQSQLSLDLRPVQRDGGQRLNGDNRLYYETRAQSEAELQLLQGN